MERDAEHHGDDDRPVDDGDDVDMEPIPDDPEVPEADAIEQAASAERLRHVAVAGRIDRRLAFRVAVELALRLLSERKGEHGH